MELQPVDLWQRRQLLQGRVANGSEAVTVNAYDAQAEPQLGYFFLRDGDAVAIPPNTLTKGHYRTQYQQYVCAKLGGPSAPDESAQGWIRVDVLDVR